MAYQRSWLLWLLCLLKATGSEPSREDISPEKIQVNAILGQSVIFHLKIPEGKNLEDITWSHSGVITSITVGEAGEIIQKQMISKKYRNRVKILNNYSLCINNLGLWDEGIYKADINTQNSDITITQEFNLEIHEELKEPQVRMNCTMSEDGHCIVFLTCSVNARRNNVKYNWSPLGPDATVFQGGSVIKISKTLCDIDQSYTCTASNLVSNSSNQFTPSWDLCTGLATSEGNLTPTIVIGTVGDLIIFPLEIPSETERVFWISNTSLIKNERREMGKKRVKTQGSDRRRDSAWDFSLQIPKVQRENQGLYTAHVCTNSSRIPRTQWYSLQVYKHLKKPEGTMSLRTKEKQTCIITMTCQVQGNGYGDNVAYSWKPLGEGAVMTQEGSVLSVSWKPGDNKVNYTCTAKNPVSNSSHSFPAWQFCLESKKNTKAWLGMLGLLGLVVPCCYVWKKKRQGHYQDFCSFQNQSQTSEGLPEYKNFELAIEGSSKREGTLDSDTSSENDMIHNTDCKRTLKHDTIKDECDMYDSANDGEVPPEKLTYMQFNLENSPNPQKNENSNTIYCMVKMPHRVQSLKTDTESPEASSYENI